MQASESPVVMASRRLLLRETMAVQPPSEGGHHAAFSLARLRRSTAVTGRTVISRRVVMPCSLNELSARSTHAVQSRPFVFEQLNIGQPRWSSTIAWA